MSERVWNHSAHVDAGYHEQEWGPIPTADSQLLGTYETPGGDTVTVSLVPSGVTGNPELELAWNAGRDEAGHKVTVIDEATAIVYLIECGAITVEPDEDEPKGEEQ